MSYTVKYIDEGRTLIKRSDQPNKLIPVDPRNADYQDILKDNKNIAEYTRPVATQNELLAHLAEYRWKHEVGGVTVTIPAGTFPVHTDDRSQCKMAAILLGSFDPAFTTSFKNKNKRFVSLDARNADLLAKAVGDHVKKAYNAEAVVQPNILNGTIITIEEVETAFDAALKT